MGERFARGWSEFWGGEDCPRNLTVARILLAGVALWVVASRFDLPSIVALPDAMWEGVSPERRIRFLLLLPVGVERVLYALLHLALLAAMLGYRPRLTCLASGLLLYHFAPLEVVIRTPNPYLRGLTLSTLGLLVLAFVPPGAHPRWPVRLIRVFIVEMYLFAGYAKLVTSGLSWVEPENVRNYLLVLNEALGRPETAPAYAVAALPWACGLLAWGGLVFELSFPLALFAPVARNVLIPLAILFHIANVVLFLIPFQAAPLLLIFFDWGPSPGSASSPPPGTGALPSPG